MNSFAHGPAARLLAKVGGLAYPARQQEFVRAAQSAQRAGSIDELLQDLTDSSWWGRRVAVELAAVVRHRHHILNACADLDVVVARRAWQLAVRFQWINPGEIAQLITDLPQSWRARIVREVRAGRLSATAQVVFPVLRERFGDAEAVALLPVCPPEVVAAVLPELEHEIANWSHLARRHPDIFLNHVRRRLRDAPPAGAADIWQQHLSGLAALAVISPRDILDLLESSAGDLVVPGGQREINALARFAPQRLLRVLLHPRYPEPIPVGRRLFEALVGLPDTALSELAEALPPGGFAVLLKALQPARRPAIFAEFIQDGPLEAVGLGPAVLDLLPAPARATQADRLRQLRPGIDDPAARRQLTARLPWAQARELLLPITSEPQAADRSVGYQLLLNAAGGSRDPAVLTQALGLLTRLKNDQDPVRLAAISALAELPSWLLVDDAIPTLRQIAQDATEARDCSPGTRSTVHRIAAKMLVEGALSRRTALTEAAMQLWLWQAAQFPSINLRALSQHLPAGGEQQIFSALKERIAADATWGRFQVALDLAEALERRAWLIPRLQSFVGQACSAADDMVVRRAIRLWLADPRFRDDRVAVLVQADASCISLVEVQRVVNHRRTDLLDVVLNHSAGGRFQRAGVVTVPTFAGSFSRWLPHQLSRYAALLLDIVTTPGRSVWDKAQAIRTMSQIPGTASTISGFVNDAEVGVAEAAMAALARIEDPASRLPELVSRAGGANARVAMYAITGAIRAIRPSLIGQTLLPLLSGPKITTRKEVVRLLAEHRVPGAVDILTAAWDAEGQHRDVRRAIVSACRWYLNDDRSWRLLERASTGNSIGSALLVYHPKRIAVRYRTRFAGLIRAAAESTEPTLRRAALDALGSWGRWDDGLGIAMLVDIAGDVSRTPDWEIALRALIFSAGETGETEALHQVALVLQHTADPIAPTTGRDQPARQRLVRLAGEVGNAARQHTCLRTGAALIADDLAATPTLSPIAMRLAVASLDWPAPTEQLESQLGRLAELAQTNSQVELMADDVRRQLVAHLRRPAPVAWVQMVGRLQSGASGKTGDETGGETTSAAGRLAVAITAAAGQRARWPLGWREQLVALRGHPDLGTRTAALDTNVYPE